MEEKKEKRREIINEHNRKLRKKRALQEVDRLERMLRGNFPDANSKADFLLTQEIKDKKLHRNFLYSSDEPETYKNLLRKRRNAINQKYEEFRRNPNEMTARLFLRSKKIIQGEQDSPLEISSVKIVTERAKGENGLSWRQSSLGNRYSTPKKLAPPPTNFLTVEGDDGISGIEELPQDEKLIRDYEGISPLQLFNKKLIREGDLLRQKLPEIVGQKLTEDLERQEFLLRAIEINGNSRSKTSVQDFKYIFAFSCLKRAEIHCGIDIFSQACSNNSQKLQIITCMGKTSQPESFQ